jgi:hypothetical protein
VLPPSCLWGKNLYAYQLSQELPSSWIHVKWEIKRLHLHKDRVVCVCVCLCVVLCALQVDVYIVTACGQFKGEGKGYAKI